MNAVSPMPALPMKVRLAASSPSGKRLPAFRGALRRWYDRNRRELPWRNTRDPYRIWVSEIMLQQTRVAAVLDHYRIFLKRYPDVKMLAAAIEDEVLAAWSGLGYYRRARMLHQCAREVVHQHGGRFPRTSQDLRQLPGIGRYTAAAIASIAFAEPIAVVDGNVERVLQRLIGANLNTTQIWPYAQSLLDSCHPGDFNQAMMELGATICVPRAPRCLACPVRRWCAAQGDVPRAEPVPRQQKKEIWCVLDRRSRGRRNHDRAKEGDGGRPQKVRLVRRPKSSSLMPGMWELPQSVHPPRAGYSAAHWRTFRHSITVTDYTVHVLGLGPVIANKALPGGTAAAKGQWIATDRIPLLPITGLTRKILKAGGII